MVLMPCTQNTCLRVGDGVCLEKAPETGLTLANKPLSRGSQAWLYWAITWELLKDTDAWAHPWRFSFNWSGWGPNWHFKKAPQVILMCSQPENPVVNGLDRIFLSCSDGRRALSGRGWALAPPEAPGPAPRLKAPAGLLLQESIHLNFEGPGSKYVRSQGPSSVCQSYFNSAAEAEKQPQTMCKRMSTAVFQRNFIYGTEMWISYNFLVWFFFPAI